MLKVYNAKMLNIKGLQLSILNFSRPSLCDDIKLGKIGQQLLNLLESFKSNNFTMFCFPSWWSLIKFSESRSKCHLMIFEISKRVSISFSHKGLQFEIEKEIKNQNQYKSFTHTKCQVIIGIRIVYDKS